MVFQLAPSTPRNSECDIGSWATPQSRDTKGQTQNPDRQDALPNQIKATGPTPQAMDAIGHAQTKENPTPGQTGGTTLPGAIKATGTPTSGPLAQMEKFVDRLMALSAWLMGYTAQYLAVWEIASCRKSRRKSSEP